MVDGKTILLAEDELPVRRLVSEVLHRSGFSVLEAHSGPDALELWHRRKGSVDLLVADCDMPGMTGFELADRLRGSDPNLGIILMSGSPEQIANSHIRGWAFLRKPFAPEAMIDLVKKTLEQKEPRKTKTAG